MSNFGKNPTVWSRLAFPVSGAAFAVLAITAVNIVGGFSGSSSAAPTALDELAAAVLALEAQGIATTQTAMLAPPSAAEARARNTAPQPAPQPVASPAPAPAPAPDLTLAALTAEHAAATETTLAALVAASASAGVLSEPTVKAEPTEAATEADAHEHGHGEHEMMMEMMAPDPDLSPCVAELKTVASRARVYFAPGSAELDARSRAFTTVIGFMAAKCPQAKVTVEGFADPTGDYTLNTRIAAARAEQTLAALRNVAGADARFSAKSHLTGESHPDFCPHYDAVDRRVEFHVEEAEMSLAEAN